MDHRHIVAWIFRLFALVAGLPALAMLIKIGVDVVSLRNVPPVSPSPHLDIKTYGLVALLSDGAQGLGALLGLLGGLGVIAMVVIAIVAVLALLFAVLLFFTARGIDHHAGWARGTGIVLTGMFLVSWVGLLFTADRSIMAVPVLGSVLALYMIWVLAAKFA